MPCWTVSSDLTLLAKHPVIYPKTAGARSGLFIYRFNFIRRKVIVAPVI